jgi:effector-binding domain-containing protein
MMDHINKSFAGLEAASKQGKVHYTGAALFVYHGVTQDFAKPFTLDIGYLAADDAKAAGEFKVRKLDEFRCATVLYTGPVTSIHAAYGKLMPALGKAGHKPTTENREYYMYYETPDSPNDVTMVAVGIE